jgi:excisionase family DNA binding protein
MDRITPNEAADILGVTSQSLRNYIKQGLIPAVRIGARYKLNKSDVENFLLNGNPTNAAKKSI